MKRAILPGFRHLFTADGDLHATPLCSGDGNHGNIDGYRISGDRSG